MKTTGRIIKTIYGFGTTNETNELFGADKLRGEHVWGLTLWIATDKFAVMDFIGVTLSDYPISFGAFVRTHHTSGVITADILKAAGKRTIDELVGVHVDVDYEDGKLVSWKVK